MTKPHGGEVHTTVAEALYDNLGPDRITSVYIGTQIGHSRRPCVHHIQLDDVNIVWQRSPSGDHDEAYLFSRLERPNVDADAVGTQEVAEMVEYWVELITPPDREPTPQPIKFEGSDAVLEAIIGNLELDVAEEFEIRKEPAE